MVVKRLKKVTVLLPALNEESAITQTLDSVPVGQFSDAGYEVEMLIVDGGSRDKTAELAAAKGAVVVSCEKGYGRQYKKGYSVATGDIIVSADSDCSYPLEDSFRLVRIMEESSLDYISANRFASMEKGAMPLLNKIGNRVLTFLCNLLFGLRLKDSQSGMWVIRKQAYDRLILERDDMTFSQEIKIEAYLKLRAKEIDSSYKKRLGDVKLRRWKDGVVSVYHLISKRLRL